MISRRIREHVATQNWFAVAIDLVIVIVGVFLAAQATTWNESRVKRDQSLSYRARLIDELDFNARQYGQQIAYYGQVRDHGLAALNAMSATGGQLGQPFLVNAYHATQIDPTPAKRFIFDEMLSAGLVDRLGGQALQDRIGDYYLQMSLSEAEMREIAPYRDILRAEMPYDVQSAIRGQCGDQLVMFDGRVIGLRLPQGCSVKLDPQRIQASIAQLRAVPGLEGALTRHIASVDQKLSLFKLSRSQTVELAEALKARQ